MDFRSSPQIHPPGWLTAPIQSKVKGMINGICWSVKYWTMVSSLSCVLHHTGLENTIKIYGQPVATSFTGGIEQLEGLSTSMVFSKATEDAIYNTFQLTDQAYYSAKSPLDKTGVEADVASSVAEFTAPEQNTA